MTMIGNIKNSFKYPFLNLKQWAIVSLLFMIGNIILFSGCDVLYLGLDIVFPIVESYTEIFVILSVIVSIFVLGYCISILKNTIEKSNEMPSFNIKSDFINGLKYIIVAFAYLIIPFLIFIGLAYLMNVIQYIGC